MGLCLPFIKFTNKLLPPVVHPFNLQNDKKLTYAQWQYEKGRDTIALFLEKYTPEEMFAGKRVLDMGCGAAGKSLYYASLGAAFVTGVDIVAHYEQEANDLARSLGLADKFRFVCASASGLPFADGTFDVIIMNDFVEHVSDPEGALREAMRLLAAGGRIYINFPPYFHPYGAHLSDAVNMPWIHLLFSERALVAAYKELIKGLPDEKERLSLRISTDERGREYFGYINKMKLKRFKAILEQLHLQPVYYREVPLRPYFALLARLPGLKEAFVRMAVCALEKPGPGGEKDRAAQA